MLTIFLPKSFKLIIIQNFISVNETGRRKCLEVGIYLNCLDQELLSPVMLFYRLCGWAQHFHNCFLFFRKSGKQHLHCTMCCFYSSITLYPKTEIQKPLSHGKKKLFLRLFSFGMKTIKLSRFLFSGTNNMIFGTIGKNNPEIANLDFEGRNFLENHVFLPTEQAGTNIC